DVCFSANGVGANDAACPGLRRRSKLPSGKPGRLDGACRRRSHAHARKCPQFELCAYRRRSPQKGANPHNKPLPASYAQVRLPRFMHPPYFMHPPVRKAPHHGHGTVIHVTHDGIKSAYRTFIKNKPSFPRSSFNETESVLHEL